MANPPGYGGPDYDDHLCGELGRLGVDVELVTSRFRFGDVPQPAGYRRTELFYPLSSRLFRRSRLRIPVKVAELQPVAESYLAPTADHPAHPSYPGAVVLAAHNGVEVSRFAIGDAVRYASPTAELPPEQRIPARVDTLHGDRRIGDRKNAAPARALGSTSLIGPIGRRLGVVMHDDEHGRGRP